MEKKSCFNCKNAVVDAGYEGTREEQGCPASLEDCKAGIPEELYSLTEEEMAEKCGKYAPIMVEKCCECGKEINQPQYSWEFWVIFYDRKPACSLACQKLGDAKIDADIKAELATLGRH